DEMQKLGSASAVCFICIMDESHISLDLTVANRQTQTNALFKCGINDHPVMRKMYDNWKTKIKSFVLDLQGEELSSFRLYLKNLGVQMVAVNPANRRAYTMAYFNKGLMGIASDDPLSPGTIELLERFAIVFDGTYNRFLDLKKAEVQAREAQVETALERIRSRTMAMQRSDELAETVSIVFRQLIGLGIKSTQMRTCAIVTLKPDEPVGECWITNPEGKIVPRSFTVSYGEGSSYNKNIYAAWKKGEKFMVVHLSGEALAQHLNNLKKNAGIPVQQFQATPDQPSETFTHAMFFSQGYLLIISNEPLSEYHDIFKRFGNVFQQTYTRFLDLQKAEAQAREARLEAALERVRFKAMAMQNSEDVGAATAVVFDEISLLNIETLRCGIAIFLQNNMADVWAATSTEEGKKMKGVGRIDLQGHPLWVGLFEAWSQKKENYVYHLKGDDLRSYYKTLTSQPNYKAPYVLTADLPDHYFYANFFEEGTIFTFSIELHKDENQRILKRFTSVFALTFRRYQDLQRAEAQAREAEIELALERVRAKTMAMQKSEELGETTLVLFQQFKSLGATTAQVSICIFDEDVKMGEMFLTLKGEKINRSFTMELDKEVFVMKKAKEMYLAKQRSFFVTIRGKELQDYNHWRNSLIGKKAWDESDEVHKQSWNVNGVFFSRGLMGVSSDTVVSVETLRLLDRFANVFDLTFTRFIDLKRAEAQVREAQIEAALERVRSRTMAMFKSDELAETAVVMFKQLIGLGVEQNRLYIAIIKDTSGYLEFWMTDENGDKISSRHIVNINKNISIKKMFEGWSEKKKTITIDMQGNELEDWLTYWREDFQIHFKPGAALKRRVQNIAYFSKGFIAISSPEDQPKTTIDLLERFAGVFDLTYTRFLDLQKAEAQAREATIETSLERVRSKTMAMHKSNDLLEVINILSEQFQVLGFNIHSANFNTSYREKDWNLWLYNPGTPIYPDQIRIPYFDHPFFNRVLESIARGDDFNAAVFTKEEKDGFLDHLYSTTIAKNAPAERKKFSYGAPGFAWSTVYLKNTSLTIANYTAEPYTEEQNIILRRFGNVFEQSYTRFLDLQKAEAQAREAQIEASLERVRSKTMAMHSSQDVADTVLAMFNELVRLGIEPMRCGIGIMTDDTTPMELWTAKLTETGKADLVIGHMDMQLHPLLQGAFNGWKNRQETFSYILKDVDLANYFTAINNYADYPINYNLADLPATVFHNDFYFPEGTLFVFSREQLTLETVKVFKR
ncbi:MAG TPA: hypothetical protein VGI82_02430, partial [Chitinophagaceae bacterium]